MILWKAQKAISFPISPRLSGNGGGGGGGRLALSMFLLTFFFVSRFTQVSNSGE
jgi:hypothetical protein